MCTKHGVLNPVNTGIIEDICLSFNNDASNLISILHRLQKQFGYLPTEIQEAVASRLSISTEKVYGVVSFYTFFTTKPKGKHSVAICLGTACCIRGAEQILEELRNVLRINVGETTPDELFSLDNIRCTGACGLAPVLMIGEDVHGRIEVSDVKKLLSQYE